MSHRKGRSNYIIISPVKDEEKYVERTINAVLGQTTRPSRWIIVDDGSRDNTPSILDRYAKRVDWITVLTLVKSADRQPGSGVIRAFAAGYGLVQDGEFDFIVKLDCDLDFAPNYFEQLIAKFDEDENLGIASGIYLEKRKDIWVPIKMPHYHAAGASKLVRAKCFQDIGGFIPHSGWDAVDEIRAQVAGWETRHFEELKLYHLKDEGFGIGFLRTNLMSGEIHYLTGGGKLFFLLKVIHRMCFGRPFFLGGLVMLFGFLQNCVSRRQKLVSNAEAKFYQQLLNRRIINGIVKGLRWLGSKRKAWRYT